jgi:hypothetical protein
MQTQGVASAVQTSRRRVGKSGRRAASRANGAWRSLLLAGTCAAAMVARAAGRVIPSFELVYISATIRPDSKFAGAAVAGDGRVVFAPLHADGVGVFDPRDDSFTLVNISATIDSDFKFAGAALAGDGRVVFAPYRADGVGVFDPTDDSFTLVNISATIDSDFKFNGAAVAGDGRVVFAPRNAHGVGLFNPPCTCCESEMMRFGFSAGRVCVLPPP